MSDNQNDNAAYDRMGLAVLASIAAFMVIQELTRGTFLAMVVAILSFLLVSGRLAALVRLVNDHLNHRGVSAVERRGLEDAFISEQVNADNYWSSYDPSLIWEQRSEEIEASGQQVTLYAQLRSNIPELAGPAYRPTTLTAPQLSPNEPLRDFWARYHSAHVNGLGFSRSGNTNPDVASFDTSQRLAPDYSHLLPHLGLIAETEYSRQALAEAAKHETGELGSDLAKMVAYVDVIVAAIRANPSKLGDVQRLFTYYLPEVGKLLQARRQMLAIEETSRIAEIDAILDRIETAFAQFAVRIHDADIRALDIDLKLLDQSLVSEFETVILP